MHHDLDSAEARLGELRDWQSSREENLLENNITGDFTVFRFRVGKILVLKVENSRYRKT